MLGHDIISAVVTLADESQIPSSYGENVQWRFVMDNALQVMMPAMMDLAQRMAKRMEYHMSVYVCCFASQVSECVDDIASVSCTRFIMQQTVSTSLVGVILLALGCVVCGARRRMQCHI